MDRIPRDILVLVFFLALSTAFTWPLALAPWDAISARDPDAYTMIWLLWAASDLEPGLRTMMSSWPAGQDLMQADTHVLVALGATVGRLLHPTTINWALGLLGPTLSAWAAERLTRRELEVPLPWSLIAGIGYAFTGLCASSLLCGQTYNMLVPWLPLLAGALLRLTGPQARLGDGAWAALWWTLCLLTTAYLGLAATVLVAIILGRALLRQPRPQTRPLLLAAGLALALGIAYVALFASGDSPRGGEEFLSATRTMFLSGGSASLSSLAAWTRQDELSPHRLMAVLPFVPAVLAIFAPRVLRRRPHWREFMVVAAVGLAISLGPRLSFFGLEGPHVPWILAPLTGLGFMDWLRFPLRFVWLTYLGLGVVGAMVASRLARAAPRALMLLLAAAVLDVLLRCQPLGPAVMAAATSPSAYRAAPAGAGVLDIIPTAVQSINDYPLYFNNLACLYQVEHHRPVMNPCLDPTTFGRPRSPMSATLVESLLDDRLWTAEAENPGHTGRALRTAGIGAVAVRPLLVPLADRELLLQRLELALGQPLASTTDGGEWIHLFPVPESLAKASDSTGGWR